jgi:rod shape-determining protein MreB and related proteins
MGFENPLSLLVQDLAIDLGTANTIVAVKGQGVVLDEPSVLAIRQRGKAREVVAVGAGAKDMLGKTPDSIRAVRPLSGGVIRDYDAAEAMLRYFIARSVGKRSLVKPRVLVCVPFGITDEQRRAVQECARAAGAREVLVVHGPVAAALGAGLPAHRPLGTLICDVGAGTTEIAVLSMGGVVTSASLDVAGDAMDQAIVAHMQEAHGMEIGEPTAEIIKIELGCGLEGTAPRSIQVKGRQKSGIPKPVTLGSADARQALQAPIQAILDALAQTFQRTPPELSADILDAGLVLTGGAAQLAGLDELVGRATGLPVVLAPQPLRSAVTGAELLLEQPALLRSLIP